jgi:hypothetical protein
MAYWKSEDQVPDFVPIWATDEKIAAWKGALNALFEQYPAVSDIPSDQLDRWGFKDSAGTEEAATRWRSAALDINSPRRSLFLADGAGVPQEVLIAHALLIYG